MKNMFEFPIKLGPFDPQSQDFNGFELLNLIFRLKAIAEPSISSCYGSTKAEVSAGL
jgi:hypothetical protein